MVEERARREWNKQGERVMPEGPGEKEGKCRRYLRAVLAVAKLAKCKDRK